jgi:protein ImuB
LPLATLTALRPHAQALQHLGCRTWGALRALPRAGVARRFGAACLAALDQAWGDAPEAAAWIELPAQFALEVELPALAESSTALLRPAERLLLALQGWLRARHQGVLALELAWRHDLRRHDGVELPPWQALVLRTAEPQQDMAHLRRLLAERLGRQRLAAPASHVALRSLQTGPMPEASHGLLPADPHAGQGVPWQELVERLSARLGPQAVQVPQLHADHRPECMQRWYPAVQPPPVAATPSRGAYGGLLPPWLLRPPRPLVLRGSRPCLHGQPLRLLAGPQRVEAGWWEAAPEPAQNAAQDAAGSAAAPGLVRRDYFVAHNAVAGWVWVFRDRGTGGWFLHGVYA